MIMIAIANTELRTSFIAVLLVYYPNKKYSLSSSTVIRRISASTRGAPPTRPPTMEQTIRQLKVVLCVAEILQSSLEVLMLIVTLNKSIIKLSRPELSKLVLGRGWDMESLAEDASEVGAPYMLLVISCSFGFSAMNSCIQARSYSNTSITTESVVAIWRGIFVLYKSLLIHRGNYFEFEFIIFLSPTTEVMILS